MTLDRGLIAACRKALETSTVSHPRRKFVRLDDMLAVIKKESTFSPFFSTSELQYQQNMRTAVKHTGWREGEIRKLITLPQQIAQWNTPTVMTNRIAKWRLEPAWYHLESTGPSDSVEKFYWASSWGLGQMMGFNIVKEPYHDIQLTILRFAADIPLQLLYLAGTLDDQLISTMGTRTLAYTRYNAGPKAKETWDAYKHYGKVVEGFRVEIEQQLKGMGYAI